MKNIKKTITVITSNYPAPGHAANVFVQQLVHAFIELGVDITVIAPQSIVHSIKHLKKLVPRHSKCVTETGIAYEVYRPYTISAGGKDIRFVKYFNKKVISKLVKNIQSDILYCHFWSSTHHVYDYALANKLPLFVACGEGDDALENMVETMPKEKIQRLVSAVTGVVSVSSENKRKCLDFGLITKDKIDVFPNCVNTSVFHQMDVASFKKDLGITKNDFVIGFVGGFVPRKGPDRIAKAITKLNDPNIKVIFAGKPFPGYPYDFDCPGILHKGPLEHDQLPLYMNCADVFVMPTQKEGCCNAIVEALAIGLPVISSEGPFNDDILNEKNSIRINPDDVDAIAASIKKLKDDKALRQSMADYSLSRHEEYSIQGRAKRILDFINRLN